METGMGAIQEGSEPTGTRRKAGRVNDHLLIYRDIHFALVYDYFIQPEQHTK